MGMLTFVGIMVAVALGLVFAEFIVVALFFLAGLAVALLCVAAVVFAVIVFNEQMMHGVWADTLKLAGFGGLAIAVLMGLEERQARRDNAAIERDRETQKAARARVAQSESSPLPLPASDTTHPRSP